MTPWTVDQPVARPLPTHKITQTQNKGTQTSMPRVGFESTTPMFERAKTVHALDRAATVISSTEHGTPKIILTSCWYRYVDDTYVIWARELDELQKFHQHLNNIHTNIKLTMEIETKGSLPFLDVLVTKKPGSSVGHSVYMKKPPHTDLYLHAKSHHDPSQKHAPCDTECLRNEIRHREKHSNRTGTMPQPSAEPWIRNKRTTEKERPV
jgi:hypothetical protein